MEVPEGIINGIAELCSKLRVEGARPDLAILKAARALAAFNARSVVESGDVLEVFDFAVGHRIKEDGTVARGRLSKKELRRILSGDTSTRVVEISEKELPLAEASLDPTHPPASPVRGRVRRIRIPKPLDYVLYVMTLAVLLLALSFVSSTMSVLIRAIVFRTPITVLQEALSPFQILLHFLLWASILMATALISRRLRRPIIYLYTYLGQGGRRQIVQRQFQPDEGEVSAGKKGERSSALIKVPIYASLRRLYRVLVTKGMKLLDVIGAERKRYRFSFETRRGPKDKKSYRKAAEDESSV